MAKKDSKKSGKGDKPGKTAKTKPTRAEMPGTVIVNIEAKDAETAQRVIGLMATIHVRKAAAVANREAAFEDRDDIVNRIAELGVDAKTKRAAEYLALCADRNEVLDKIEALGTTIKAANNAYDKLAEECQQGRFSFAEKTVDEFLASAGSKSKQESLPFSGVVLPGDDLRKYVEAKPSLFEDREWAIVASCVNELEEDCRTPMQIAGFVAHCISEQDDIDGAQLFPGPPWFRAGLVNVLYAAATAELCKGDEEGEIDAGRVLSSLQDAARENIDAIINMCGSKDHPLAKLLAAH